jgi:hypothetical protein
MMPSGFFLTSSQLEALVSGKILKKYRGMKYISNEIKLNRHRLAKVKSKQLTPNRRQRLVDHQERMKKLVQDFLNRDDNSRILPNKNDVKNNPDGIMQPKRTFNTFSEFCHSLKLQVVLLFYPFSVHSLF